jgi:hypothetical protein
MSTSCAKLQRNPGARPVAHPKSGAAMAELRLRCAGDFPFRPLIPCYTKTSYHSLYAGSVSLFSLYRPRFLTDLYYTQFCINAVSVTAELAMYLSVPLFGYPCDRYSPPPLSILAYIFFGTGCLLAAFLYKSGAPRDASGDD